MGKTWSKIGKPVFNAELEIDLRGRAGNPPFTVEKNALMCVACSTITPLLPCENCGAKKYVTGLSTSRHTGLFCASCKRGFTSFTCACGCENPVDGNTVARQGGCFIATAATSRDSIQVLALSQFRDDFLIKHYLGRKSISLYESVSPSVAKLISNSPLLRFIVRSLVVTPAYCVATLLSRRVNQR